MAVLGLGCGMWDLIPCWELRVLATGPPGESLDCLCTDPSVLASYILKNCLASQVSFIVSVKWNLIFVQSEFISILASKFV